MCAGLCPTYWTTFGSAEKNRNVAVHCTNETATHFFELLTFPPPASQGPMDRRGGRGTSADIIPTCIQFGVDPSTRCWDIAQKPPKCKNSPLTPIVTKNLFTHFSGRRGPLIPQKGEDTSGTRVRPHAKFGLNPPAGYREIVDNKNLAIANRSRVSCAHNTLRASIGLNITLWPWNLG